MGPSLNGIVGFDIRVIQESLGTAIASERFEGTVFSNRACASSGRNNSGANEEVIPVNELRSIPDDQSSPVDTLARWILRGAATVLFCSVGVSKLSQQSEWNRSFGQMELAGGFVISRAYFKSSAD